MNARQTDLSRAMTEAIQRAVSGGSVRTTVWTRREQIGNIAATGQADPVMTPDGDLYFLADYSEADGPDITG